jgi:hypothetical protein
MATLTSRLIANLQDVACGAISDFELVRLNKLKFEQTLEVIGAVTS